MKFKRQLKIERGLNSMDIAPLMNIILLLLIFFMLTSTFVNRTGLSVNLPGSVTSEIIRNDNIDIVLNAKNEFFVNEKQLTLEELENFIKQLAGRDVSVLIKADRQARLSSAVLVWDLCRRSGLSRINIATDQE
jgi:biopolymer transport protein ExbD